MQVVIVWTEFVDERKAERGYECEPSDNLITQGKTLLGLKRGNAGACDDDCEQNESDLNAHNRT